MTNVLEGKVVAILATDGFEQSELESPLEALNKAGAQAKIVSIKQGNIKAWKDNNWGKEFKVDLTLDEISETDFDALVLPGGVQNPDKLRNNEKAVTFVKQFADRGKPIAAICHGPSILINANAVNGRTMTSYSSIRVDLENAGAHWVDQPVAVDNGLVTSRCPDDLPAFNGKMIEEIREGRHSVAKNIDNAGSGLAIM